MAKGKLTTCRACGGELAKSAKVCPHCGARNKKPLFKKWWFWAILVVFILAFAAPKNDTPAENTASEPAVGQVTTEKTAPSPADQPTTPVKTEYRVGDIIEDGNTKIVFMSSGDYTEENTFMQPAEGNKYIFLRFAFENTSTTSDTTVSLYDFSCYADGYAADMHFSGNDELSATLSAGRGTTGYLYFEVPSDAQTIEVEYVTNYFTEDKIRFLFEGDKDSGYVQQLNAAPTADAHKVGDVVESSKLKITYLSCEEYASDNMFVTPAEGYRYVSCGFAFENVGSSDEHISSMSFDCYADGVNCKGIYIREDDLSATLSAGRKAKGTVTFEVPTAADVIEVEYLSNYWTSNRVVFTVE